jgi:hypothetical protein
LNKIFGNRTNSSAVKEIGSAQEAATDYCNRKQEELQRKGFIVISTDVTCSFEDDEEED